MGWTQGLTQERKKKKMRFFFVSGTSHCDAQSKCARDVASIKKRGVKNQPLCKSVLLMHTKGRWLQVRHVEPPEAVYVILSFLKGQAWGKESRESATLREVEDALPRVTTCKHARLWSMSWISSAYLSCTANVCFPLTKAG